MADTFPLVSNEVVTEDRVAAPHRSPGHRSRTTRYFWTVVPVGILIDEDRASSTYWDVETPQDACQAGRMATFGKRVAAGDHGLRAPRTSPVWRRTAAALAGGGLRPAVYSSPLVAWRPVVGATGYEVQWSRVKYPWRKRGSEFTFATAPS